jgi:phospholipase D1/2
MLTDTVDRTKSSRMGWSDISISLSGPILDSLAIHFTQRW